MVNDQWATPRAVYFSVASTSHCQDMPLCSAFGGIKAFVFYTYPESLSNRCFINTWRVFASDVLDSTATCSPPGRLALCRPPKRHVPGVVAEDVETHGPAFDQERLPIEEERGSPLRGRRLMRRQIANPPITSNHPQIRRPFTTKHGEIHHPFPQRSRTPQKNPRIHRARVGATRPWRTAGPTSSA